MSDAIRTNYDTPWKLIIEKYFQLLLEFLFPHIANEIDWTKPHQDLDKELLAIQKNAKVGNKISDKLIKVFKKTGEEAWVIVHIEIQGKKEDDFAERLFQYYTRIYNRYQVPLVTLAILTDDTRSWRPTKFHRELWGCHLTLTFPIIKLIDYHSRQEILEKSKNPIAKVIQAHLTALLSKGNRQLKFENKLRLVKNLYSLGYTGDDIRLLYEFIDYEFNLPADLESEFMSEILKFENEVNMPYISSAERMGIEKGLLQGLSQGTKLASQKMFLLVLRKYFTNGIPEHIAKRVEEATPEKLEQWLDQILEDKFMIAEIV